MPFGGRFLGKEVTMTIFFATITILLALLVVFLVVRNRRGA
jgi:uncharacterized membrane protein